MFHGHLDYFQKPSLGGWPNTKPGDHGTPNVHNHWFILFYHVWGPAWIEIHWNSIRLRARSHMTSRYTWRSMTTLHEFGGVLRQPLDTFFWALTISWSRPLACAAHRTWTKMLKLYVEESSHKYFYWSVQVEPFDHRWIWSLEIYLKKTQLRPLNFNRTGYFTNARLVYRWMAWYE